MKNDAQRAVRGVTLVLASVLFTVAGSFAASAMAMNGIELYWLVSAAGYVLGAAGVVLLLPYDKHYKGALGALLAGGCTVLAQRMMQGTYQLVGISSEVLFQAVFLLITGGVTVWNFAELNCALRMHLRSAGAPEALASRGKHWTGFTALAIALSATGSYGVTKLPLSAHAQVLVQLCLLFAGFAFMVSALVIGIRFLLAARRYFIHISGGKL